MLEKLQDDALVIIKRIEKLRSEDEVLTFKVARLLKELVALLEQQKEDNQEIIKFLYQTYNYVGDMFANIGRFALSAKYHQEALELARRLENTPENIVSVFSKLLRDRNYYVDDDCEDVKELVKGMISEQVIEKELTERKNHRRSLKHDPVEMSKEYLDVIDEVEEKISKNRTIFGMGACHEIWHLKYVYLAERGIQWRSPAVLNPRVMFD